MPPQKVPYANLERSAYNWNVSFTGEAPKTRLRSKQLTPFLAGNCTYRLVRYFFQQDGAQCHTSRPTIALFAYKL